jgi:hypothetical protein
MMIGPNEVQTAARAGFARFTHFQRALKVGLFPKPIRDIRGQGPVWAEWQVDDWLGAMQPVERAVGEALARVEKAAERRGGA